MSKSISQSDEGDRIPRPSKKTKMAGELTLGATHSQILEQRKSLKKQIHSLPKDQKSKVLSHFHGSYRTDLSKQRLKNLREDDKHQDTSNMSDIQRHTLEKRKRRTNPALQRQMHRRETKRLQNAIMAADAEEILHTHTSRLVEVESDMERTIQLTQQQLKNDHLQESVARNIFDLELKEYGPYKLRYDRSGRYSLLAGGAGHVSIIDQHSLALTSEFFVNETVRDACFLHNGSMMAVAQEKNVFVYDDKGVEIHRMDGHRRVMVMEFLPYHWLLGKFVLDV
jgi:U3 small nucleolar RNA-associated protein 7